MVPALPYDLWAIIASFLPKKCLGKLCSVNMAFFDLHMKEMYREVSIYHLDDESTLRCLSTMR